MLIASQLPIPVAIGAVALVAISGAVTGVRRVAGARRQRRATEAPPWHFASYHLPGRTA